MKEFLNIDIKALLEHIKNEMSQLNIFGKIIFGAWCLFAGIIVGYVWCCVWVVSKIETISDYFFLKAEYRKKKKNGLYDADR